MANQALMDAVDHLFSVTRHTQQQGSVPAPQSPPKIASHKGGSL